MKKKIVFLIIAMLIIACKSRHVTKKKVIENQTTKDVTITKSIKNNDSTIKNNKIEKYGHLEKKKEDQSEINIQGKSQDNKPFEIHHIDKGDTLSSIKIIGNADFNIKAKTIKTISENKQSEENRLETISKVIVSEENIKKTAQEIERRVEEIIKNKSTIWKLPLVIFILIMVFIIISIIYFIKKRL